MLSTIVYVSRAVRSLDPDELSALLSVARERNLVAGVTGMLIYADDGFMQQLEGESAQLAPIFASIERDPRHTDIRLLSRRTVTSRTFPDWAMGFTQPTTPDPAPAGFLASVDAPLISPALIDRTDMAEAILAAYAGR